jgi:hypothetical protein
MSDERQKCDVWHCPLAMMSGLFCFPSCKEDYDADNVESVSHRREQRECPWTKAQLPKMLETRP